MKRLLTVSVLSIAVAAQAEIIASISNAEGGEIVFTDIKTEQCQIGHSALSYGMSGRTLFGCWVPGVIDYEIKDGIVDMVVKANVVWSTGQKNTYPIKRTRAQINPSTRKTAKGTML